MCRESRTVPDTSLAARLMPLSFIAFNQVIRIRPEELKAPEGVREQVQPGDHQQRARRRCLAGHRP